MWVGLSLEHLASHFVSTNCLIKEVDYTLLVNHPGNLHHSRVVTGQQWTDVLLICARVVLYFMSGEVSNI